MCSFFERLAGPFSTTVESLDSFQPCAASNGLTFLNSTPFSLSVSIPAVDIVKLRAFKYQYDVIFNCRLLRVAN